MKIFDEYVWTEPDFIRWKEDNSPEPAKAEDMSIIRSIFGFRVVKRTQERDGTTSPLIQIFVEDDGWYHFKMAFDVIYLKELNWGSRDVSYEILKELETT